MYAILILDSRRVTRAFYWPEALFSEKINGTQFPVSFVVPFLLRQLQHVIFFCVPAESFFFWRAWPGTKKATQPAVHLRDVNGP